MTTNRKSLTSLDLTPRSLDLFRSLWNARRPWNDEPLYEGEQADNGNLLHLKKLGLVRTELDDDCVWVLFTDAGRALGNELDANPR